MKTFLKLLGAAALVAGLTPYRMEKNTETEETTYQALLWKAVNRPDPEDAGKRKLDISLGFNNPLAKDEEAHLFADELTVNYHTAPAAGEAPAAEEAPAQEEAPAEPSAEEPEAPAQEEAPEAE